MNFSLSTAVGIGGVVAGVATDVGTLGFGGVTDGEGMEGVLAGVGAEAEKPGFAGITDVACVEATGDPLELDAAVPAGPPPTLALDAGVPGRCAGPTGSDAKEALLVAWTERGVDADVAAGECAGDVDLVTVPPEFGDSWITVTRDASGGTRSE